MDYKSCPENSNCLSGLAVLNGNMLKIIALISMTLDHVGFLLMNDYLPFRIIGRLAFPIFAYMIAEGCNHTRNKKRYLAGILLLGIMCQIVYYAADRSLYQGVLITFSFSIIVIYSLNKFVPMALSFTAVIFLCVVLPVYLSGTDYQIDYGLFGVLLPVLISLPKNRAAKLAMAAVGLIAVSISIGGIQWFSLLALIPLAMYNGRREKTKAKYLFYIYYPLHMAAIYGLFMLI